MTTDKAFATLREGVQKDIKDGFDRDSSHMALAMIAIAEEALSKLERIAVAAETLAQSAVVDSYGYHSVRTAPSE